MEAADTGQDAGRKNVTLGLLLPCRSFSRLCPDPEDITECQFAFNWDDELRLCR